MNHYFNRLIRSRLPTVVALAVLLVATAFGWYWVWGILFLHWAVLGIVTGNAFVLQTVRRDESPLLFWLISVAWLVLAVLAILDGFFPETA